MVIEAPTVPGMHTPFARVTALLEPKQIWFAPRLTTVTEARWRFKATWVAVVRTETWLEEKLLVLISWAGAERGTARRRIKARPILVIASPSRSPAAGPTQAPS